MATSLYTAPMYPPGYGRLSSGFVIVSLNDANNHTAGVGFLGVVPAPQPNFLTGLNWTPFSLQDWGTVALSPTEQAPWVASNPKYQTLAAANQVHLYVPSSLHWTGLHQYTIDFTTAPPSIVPTDTDYDVTFVNTASATPIVVDGSNGGKVSWHGKLWVWAVAYPDFSGYLYGIDPYSGIIQTMIGYGYGCCPAGIFTGGNRV